MITEITSTELARPGVIEESIKSFRSKFKGINFSECTLYINIDPYPAGADRREVVKLCERHFKKVVANLPDTPNFAAALKWCWSQPTNLHFMHFEMDWVLNEKVSLCDIMEFFKAKSTVCVNLRAYPAKRYYVCLSPSIVKTTFAKKVSEHLNLTVNPEHQLRRPARAWPQGRRLQSNREIGIHYPSDRVIISDIGRKWLDDVKMAKRDLDFINYDSAPRIVLPLEKLY